MESSGIFEKVNKNNRLAWRNFLEKLTVNKLSNNPKSLDVTTWYNTKHIFFF